MPVRSLPLRSVAAAAALSLSALAHAAAPRSVPLAIRFDLTPEQVDASCKSGIEAAGRRVDAILRARSRRTFATVSEPVENIVSDLNDDLAAQILLFQVAPDKAVRDASDRCNTAISAFNAALFARPDLYAALAAASRSGTARGAAQKKLLEIQLVGAKRSGAGLAPAPRQRFVEIATKITELENAYATNLSTPDMLPVARDQAGGLPADFVSGLKTDADGRLLVPVDESTYFTVLTTAASEDVRKAFYTMYKSRGGQENVQLLEQALALRDESARLLGYPNWAAYTLADRMAGTPARVDDFLTGLARRLTPVAREQRAALARLKGAPIEEWDRRFFEEQSRRQQYDLDREAVRQYFPAQHTIDAVIALYSQMLGLRFERADDLPRWHPDVVAYRVTDAASGADRGTMYLDLYPRPGKYGHFANYGPTARRTLPDGTVRPTVNTIIGNWPAPTPGKPSLLSHSDVLTFFHEFGHNVAALCADTPYETLNTGYRLDFVEAPSQMLENFVWDPAILKKISARVDTGAPLPDDLIARMNAARHFDQASTFVSTDIFYALVDQHLHTAKPPVDSTAVWRQTVQDDTPDNFVEGTHPQGAFGHFMGGYEAGYYAYAWAKVYAMDLFTPFQQHGLQDPATGMRYRREILAPARSQEPDALVRNFLGRPMKPDAFYADLGLAPGSAR